MPFDSSLVTKISPLIEGQVPDFIQSDHPKFVQFLKQYYQFLEAAELIVDVVIHNIILEKTDTQYLLNEYGTKIVTESGVGTTGKFVVGETITGGTSNATAEVLVDDLENTRLFISTQQKFEVGETITGGTSAATASIISYRANPVATIQKLLDYANPDNTVSVMLDEMFNQFMQSIPTSLASGLSKRNLIKNIKDLYSAKGTSEGHKLFLRMLLGEEAEISYPTKYMLRLSDGNWNKKSVIRCENQRGSDGLQIIGEMLTGQTSGATCFVIDALPFTQGPNSITEFQILQSSIQGTFIEGETLTANTFTSRVEMRFTIQKIIAGSIINKTGILHSSGTNIALDSSIGNGEANIQADIVSLGSLDEIIVDDAGSNYRIGDDLTFTTLESNIVSAAGFVSVVGGSTLLEFNDDSDGYNDYLTLESNTTISYPISILTYEDGTSILLDGTDGTSTDAGYYLTTEYNTPVNAVIDTYGTENDRIVFEEGTPSTAGEITRIFISDKGSGYSTLPTISITSTFGVNAKIISTTKNIGNILSTRNIDSGFNYRSSPSASVRSNFILKNITGSFISGDALTSHVGTISGWDSSKQILTITIEDVVRVEMEQNSDAVSQEIEQEVYTDIFYRIVANNVIETNDYDYWKSRGLAKVNLKSRLTSFITEDGDNIIVDDNSLTLEQITLENPDAISNLQQRKDKFQLDGSGIQLYTAGGWRNAAEISGENDRVISSHVVFTPATESTPAILTNVSHDIIRTVDNTDGILLDGNVVVTAYVFGETSSTTALSVDENSGAVIAVGQGVSGEGVSAGVTVVTVTSQTVLVLSEAQSLSDNVKLEFVDIGASTGEFLILEGKDGNGGGADVNGFYNIYEAETVTHANDSRPRLISESSEPILNESSVLEPIGGSSGKLMMDNHIVESREIAITLVLDGTDASSSNAGDNIILDGISASDRPGNTLVQESGLHVGSNEGLNDDRLGDNLLHEPESMLAGDILLNATDSDGTDAGSNIVGESGIDFVGTTISTAAANGIIIAANVPDITILNDFIFTEDGYYENTDSIISEDVIRIQDGYFYQDFSYEIKVGQSLSTYINELKRAVHPAGFAPFGKVVIATFISAAIPVAGSGLIDAPDATFSPILASLLYDIFRVKIQKRLGIPKTYRVGSYFEELRQEDGTLGDSFGDNFTLEDSSGVLMSEASAGTNAGGDHDVNFIKLFKTKINLPQPKPLVAVGLVHMALNLFSDQIGIGSIQLEDGLRKRGPTINTDRLVLDGIEVSASGDPLVLQHIGELLSLEKATSDNLGVGVGIEDFREIPIGDFIRPDLLSMESNYGLRVLDNEINKSFNNRNDIFILMEASEASGAFILENNNKSYGILEDDSGLIILDGTDDLSTNAGNNILHEIDEGVGQDITLESGTSVGIDYKLILESQRIQAEDESNSGQVPDAHWFDNSQFPSFVRPSEIFIRPHGHVKLQDILFDGYVLLNGTDGSSTNAGNYLDWENGTYSSLIGNYPPFLLGDGETFDNTGTTFYNDEQTFDVVEGA